MLITVTYKRTTEKAVLIRWEGEEYWVPRSVMTCIGQEPRDAYDEVEIEVDDWFAEKEGWV